MKIAFDASDLCTGRADGTTRYTAELAKRLPKMAADHEWVLHGPCACPITTDSAQWHPSPFFTGWTQLRFPFALFRDKPELLFMPIQQLPIFRPRTMKTVAVIHDLAFHEYPDQFRYKDWLLLHTFSAQVAREADAIIAVSQATKDDIKKYYGRTENVHVVHHGIDHNRFRLFSDSEKKEGLEKLQEKYPEIKTPYILFVGQIQPRKNIIRLVEAFEQLTASAVIPDLIGDPSSKSRTNVDSRLRGNDNGLQLVIAGGHGWNNKDIYDRVKASPIRKDIILTGAVPDELLPTLYANAEVFVLPSLQEGFGIPLIEAAACGVPLVTSNRSSMKEIAKGSGILINPEDTNSLASGIQEAIRNKSELSDKSIALAQKFSWDITAQKTLQILKGVYPELSANWRRKEVANICCWKQ